MGYTHHYHTDPLIIYAKSVYEDKSCAACGCMCTGMTYGCKDCDFFVHYSCLDLPQQLFFPNHPSHPSLVLSTQRDPCTLFPCGQCESQPKGFVFRCEENGCDYTVDAKCGYPLPAVRYPYHRHRLHFFPKLLEEVQHRPCRTCHEPCKSDVLCCLRCDFAIHSQCMRLPCLFRHRFYCPGDQVEFGESKEGIRKDEDVDERGDHDDEKDNSLSSLFSWIMRFRRRTDFSDYCDICEDEIKPETPVYYCKSCLYIVHVKCLFSEAMERGVELKMIPEETHNGGKREGKSETEDTQAEYVGTFAEIIEDLNDYERSQLEDVYKRRVAEIIKVLAWQKDADSSSHPNSPFMDEAFLEFRNKLQRGIKHTSSLALASKDDRIVKVAEYKMTEKLAPILETLFANYGDVSAESNLEGKPKILVFIMLCGTIDSMCSTKVVDVTETLLYNWWKNLIFVHLSWFDIQFAIDRLRVIACAHDNLQEGNKSVTKMEREIMDLADQIKEHEEALKDRNSKLKRMWRKGDVTIPEMDKCLMEAYSKNAFAWKWESAGDPVEKVCQLLQVVDDLRKTLEKILDRARTE